MATATYAASDVETFIELLDFYRRNPVEAVEDLLGIRLAIHQGLMLKSIWSDPYGDEVSPTSCVLFCGRGVSKSFILALNAVLTAILYPNEKILFVGPGFRQGKELMLEAERILTGGLPSQAQVPFGRASLVKRSGARGVIEKSPDAWRIAFSNSSYILAIPTSISGADDDVGGANKIRGYRSSRLLIDEVKDVPRAVIDKVLRPTMVVDMDPVGSGESRANQIIYSGTIDFESSHYWEIIQAHQKAVLDFDLTRNFVKFTYEDTILHVGGETKAFDPPYKMKISEIEKLRTNGDIPEEVWLSEYKCIPIRTAGTYYPYMLMRDACNRIICRDPEYSEYYLPRLSDQFSPVVIGADVGRIDDWSSIVVLILHPLDTRPWDKKTQSGNNDFIGIGYAWQCRNQPYSYFAQRLRETMALFPNLLAMAVDARGGEAVLDELAFSVPDGGYALLDPEDEDRDRLIPNTIPKLRILKRIAATDALNSAWNSYTKAKLEAGQLIFPKQLSYHENDDLVAASKAIERCNYQFISIQTKISPKTNLLTFFVPNRKKNKKDLYSGAIYGMAAARDFLHKNSEGGAIQENLCAFI